MSLRDWRPPTPPLPDHLRPVVKPDDPEWFERELAIAAAPPWWFWRFMLRRFSWLVGVFGQVEVSGEIPEELRRGPLILAANHIGDFDPFVVAVALHRNVVPVLVFLRASGDGVAAAEPAAEVDVGAALGAEGLERLVAGLLADRAGGMAHRLRISALSRDLPRSSATENRGPSCSTRALSSWAISRPHTASSIAPGSARPSRSRSRSSRWAMVRAVGRPSAPSRRSAVGV